MRTLFCLLLCAMSAMATQPVLVRVTPATLARLQAKDPSIRLVNPEERPDGQSRVVIKECSILHDGKNWTVVPNGALVHVPATMKDRLNAKPVGNLLKWTDFLARNRQWISSREVTFDQAVGNKEFESIAFKSGESADKIVVAVFGEGPVSVKKAHDLPSLTSR
jgi:hypothetical protein